MAHAAIKLSQEIANTITAIASPLLRTYISYESLKSHTISTIYKDLMYD